MANSPKAEPTNDITFKVFRPSLSANEVVSNEPRISATANIIDDTYGSNEAPDRSNTNTAYPISKKFAVIIANPVKAIPMPSPFNALRLTAMK